MGLFVINWVLLVVAGVCLGYAALPLFTLLLAELKGRRAYPKSTQYQHIACIITAYKDAAIAIPQVQSLLQQRYPNFHIYLVADACDQQLAGLPDERLTVIYPKPALHAKLRSIHLAMQQLVEPADAYLILDADNLIHADTLSRLNDLLNAGFEIVQGQRTAKNLDTPMAAIDALGELYYNTTQRDAAFRIGSSATIAGSGMAIEARFFEHYVQHLLAGDPRLILAEDKLLQLMAVDSGRRIAYCREAIIFDEKLATGAQVQRQRTRWLRSWFDHWRQAVGLGLRGLFSGSWNAFYFGLMLSFPPMVLLVAALLILLVIGLLFLVPLALMAGTGLVLFATGFIAALLLAPAPRAVWRALPQIPVFVLRQVLAMLNLKASSKDFLATTHTRALEIGEVWAARRQDFPYLNQQSE